MKIFLSYASPDRRTAQSIQLALLGSSHQVFFDRASLPPGGDYHTQIRKAIEDSDLIVVLISPHFATAKRRYVHSEVEIAKTKWPEPWGHVLPVLVDPTDFQNIDPYLLSVTIFEPPGDIAADVAACIDRMTSETDDLELDDIRSGVGFFKQFVDWIQSLITKKKRTYLSAIKAIHTAATESNFYLNDIREGKRANKEKERQLSMLWYEAMKAILPINPDLAEKCMIKGQCWSDSRLFNSKQYEEVPISIDYMFSETRKILHEIS